MIEKYVGQKIARLAMYEVKGLMIDGYTRQGYIEDDKKQEYYLRHPNGNCAMIFVWLHAGVYHVYINKKLVKSEVVR